MVGVRWSITQLALKVLAATSEMSAPTGPGGRTVHLKNATVWIEARPGQAERQVLHRTVLLDVSPVEGTLAFLTGPTGTNLPANQVPLLQPL
ncbi:hypothetical protein [Deinococcus hopiensis]|uniref:Uncharacterized protein n=1 Tax=Deinococcus hopiensis KR-140 TaxID=695939 RepID=A0A1W1UD51_9DEIO|nr:hypothetical protein [Deinococcus hopiensis]SMB78997.1 hypothetical protein SAMN00790413_05719 [Deinococcus hopiensis KR-140]